MASQDKIHGVVLAHVDDNPYSRPYDRIPYYRALLHAVKMEFPADCVVHGTERDIILQFILSYMGNIREFIKSVLSNDAAVINTAREAGVPNVIHYSLSLHEGVVSDIEINFPVDNHEDQNRKVGQQLRNLKEIDEILKAGKCRAAYEQLLDESLVCWIRGGIQKNVVSFDRFLYEWMKTSKK